MPLPPCSNARVVLGWLFVHWCVEGLAWYLGTHLLLVHTSSLPPGLYWRLPRPVVLERGMLVVFTPPDWMVTHLPHLRPGELVVKQVESQAGEEVCWTSEGMWLPGQFMTRPARHPLRPGLRCEILGASAVILTGTHPASFDSRAMGPVDVRRIVAQVVPLWTWGGGR